MKTRGEIEDDICEAIGRFEKDYLGRESESCHVHLIGDLLIVRLEGALTAAEKHLAKTSPAEKGRDLIKTVRTQLMETARPILQTIVEEVAGVKMVSLHHDISTTTGEQVILFTFASPPPFRNATKK
jgi:uncharacterized protein YbcI